jgi:hypothetical protein
MTSARWWIESWIVSRSPSSRWSRPPLRPVVMPSCTNESEHNQHLSLQRLCATYTSRFARGWSRRRGGHRWCLFRHSRPRRPTAARRTPDQRTSRASMPGSTPPRTSTASRGNWISLHPISISESDLEKKIRIRNPPSVRGRMRSKALTPSQDGWRMIPHSSISLSTISTTAFIL